MSKEFKTATEIFITAAQPEQRPQPEIDENELRQAIREERLPEGFELKPITKNARMQLLVPAQTKEKITGIANAQGISANEAVNRAIRAYIDLYEVAKNE